jgi:two-component system, cell cycle sensor histidine kinase and response regulator CckA
VGSDRTRSLLGVAELEETLELYRSMVRASPDAITATDLEGRITAVSQRTVELQRGIDEADLLGRSAFDFIAPEEHERALANLALTLERGVIGPVEYTMVRRDGSTFSGELCAASVHDRDGKVSGFVATVRDITEKKLAQLALAESEARYRTLVELSPDPVLILEGASFRYVNDAFTQLFGYTRADVKAGLSFFDLVPEHEDAGVRARYAARMAGQDLPATYQLDVRAKDGRLIPCETSARLIQFESSPADLVIVRDLTERARAAEQQRRLDARLQQAQKLESLGLLAGGVAHDFNNLLMAILGNVTLLRHELPPTLACTEGLSTIETTAQRASELCQQLLAYAGRRAPKTERIDLGALVSETVRLLVAALPRNARMVQELDDGLPTIVADATQLRQAIMNLVMNAADAVGKEEGVVTVRTGYAECDARFLAEHAIDSEAKPGSYVYVEVADTGAGMAPSTLERAFEPFFTTKTMGRGLGLVSVRGCLRAHRAALEVKTARGRGSTFRLLFPTEQTGPRATKLVEAEAPRTPARGLILVVDDEPLVRNVIAAVARSDGYDVLTAAEGVEALTHFRAHQPKIVALVVDMQMPLMSGVQVVRAIRELSPDMPALLTSGQYDHDLGQLPSHGPATQFIQKPFTSELLLTSLSRVLGRGERAVGAA